MEVHPRKCAEASVLEWPIACHHFAGETLFSWISRICKRAAESGLLLPKNTFSSPEH